MREQDEIDELLAARFATVGQELRTRLILVLGPTRRLLRDANLTTAQRTDLKTIFRNGNEVLDIVNGLVQATRSTADDVPAQRQDVPTIEPCSSAASSGTD